VPSAVNVQGGPIDDRIKPYLPLGEELGRLLTALADRGLSGEVTVEYLGDIAEADGRTLGLSVLKGLLAPVCSEPVTFVNAPLIAEERGLNVREVSDPTPRTTCPCCGSPASTRDGQAIRVAGTVLPGDRERLIEVWNTPVDVEPTRHMASSATRTGPGIIGAVGTGFGEAGVNIAAAQVGRSAVGGEAIMALSLDDAVPRRRAARIAHEGTSARRRGARSPSPEQHRPASPPRPPRVAVQAAVRSQLVPTSRAWAAASNPAASAPCAGTLTSTVTTTGIAASTAAPTRATSAALRGAQQQRRRGQPLDRPRHRDDRGDPGRVGGLVGREAVPARPGRTAGSGPPGWSRSARPARAWRRRGRGRRAPWGPPGRLVGRFGAGQVTVRSSRNSGRSSQARVVEHLGQLLDGVEHVDTGHVQRREPEPDQVRGPVVADHPPREQRLGDGVRLLVPERDLRAALVGRAG
jgi:hypothetical protein